MCLRLIPQTSLVPKLAVLVCHRKSPAPRIEDIGEAKGGSGLQGPLTDFREQKMDSSLAFSHPDETRFRPVEVSGTSSSTP